MKEVENTEANRKGGRGRGKKQVFSLVISQLRVSGFRHQGRIDFHLQRFRGEAAGRGRHALLGLRLSPS